MSREGAAIIIVVGMVFCTFLNAALAWLVLG